MVDGALPPLVGSHAPTSQSKRPWRPRLVWPRRFFSASRRSWDPRVGRVGRRRRGGGAAALRSTSASRSRAARRLSSWARCSLAVTVSTPSTSREASRSSTRGPQPVRHHVRPGHVDRELDPGVGGVDALAARPGRAREPLGQLAGRDHPAVGDLELVSHVSTLDAPVRAPARPPTVSVMDGRRRRRRRSGVSYILTAWTSSSHPLTTC